MRWSSNMFVGSLYKGVLSGEKPLLAQVFFDAGVLDRYRGRDGYKVVRTNTVGRVICDGGWSLDFGIAPDERSIHTGIANLTRIPPGERGHWLDHGLIPPFSQAFIQMTLRPSSCYDDGDLRPW